MDALVRERKEDLLWFNRVYTDQKGPTGPISTAVDMSRFVMAILNEGELGGRRILSRESVALMINEHHMLPGNSPEARSYKNYQQMYHGLGWYVVKNPDSTFIANGTYFPKRKILDLLAGLDW